MESYSRVYARYIEGLEYDQLPRRVVEKAKMHFLDSLGNMLAAHGMPWSQMVVSLVRKMGGRPEAKVVGDGRFPAANAALANGTMAHGVDADDSGARPSWAHPGACVNPAALAVAEAEEVDGRRLLEGVVAGYEVCCRVDSAGYPGFRSRGFHATGIAGTMGSVAAVGRIMGLDEGEMVNALGLAGTQAAGLEEWLTAGDMSKRLHAGKAAMNGVLAALLAREGYTGPETVLEGKYGLLATHTDGFEESRLVEGLGETYKLLECKFKPYACCHELCSPIRMALELKDKHGINPRDIKSIKIGLNHVTAENQLKEAETPLHAQNHPAVAVAIALTQGRVFMREFFECYSDPLVRELGRRTEVYTDPEIDRVFPTKIGTRLEITTSQGTFELFEEDKPPVSFDFVKEKFMSFATELLPEGRAREVLGLVERLESLQDLGRLTSLLS